MSGMILVIFEKAIARGRFLAIAEFWGVGYHGLKVFFLALPRLPTFLPNPPFKFH